MIDVDWSLLTNVVTVAGVLIGIFFGLRQLKDIVRSRNTDLFVDFYNQLTSRDFQAMYNNIVYVYQWTDYDDWLRKYGPDADPEAWANFNSVGYFFDGIGVLVHKKLIDIQLVDDLMSSAVIWLWDKTGPIIRERRKRRNRPQIWEWVEYLYNRIKENDGSEAADSSVGYHPQDGFVAPAATPAPKGFARQVMKAVEKWGILD